MAGKTIGDRPSILVSDLFKRGEPVPVRICRDLDLPSGGRMSVTITAHLDLVISLATISDRAGTTTHARTARVGWADWQFNGRRAWVVCSTCSADCNVLFISTGPLAGSLVCRKCAGVRYVSQDARDIPRLRAKMNKIWVRLGADAVDGFFPPFPERPKGMHKATYERLGEECIALATDLDAAIERDHRAAVEAALEPLRTNSDIAVRWLMSRKPVGGSTSC
jgi:hypothetical protein